MHPIFAYGTEEQKQRWLPDMAAGKVIGCFGLTEAHGGSDPANMKTNAKKDGGHWVINGSKMWISNGNLRSEEHTSELQSLMRTSYADYYLHKKISHTTNTYTTQ